MKLGKLLRLSAADYLLLACAALSVCAARLALWLVPFRTLSRIGERKACHGGTALTVSEGESDRKASASRGFSPARAAWAVSVASRLVGRQRVCLVRALAARWMLSLFGYPSELRIGVAKAADGKFSAHAWLESGGEIVIGKAEAQDFTPLPPLARNHSQGSGAP